MLFIAEIPSKETPSIFILGGGGQGTSTIVAINISFLMAFLFF